MRDCIGEKTQSAVTRLANSDLVEFALTDMGRTLELGFTFAGYQGGEGNDVMVRLGGIERLHYRCQPASETVYIVGEATVDCFEASPGRRLFRFRLDGELFLEAECASVQVFQEIAEPLVGATA